MPEADRVPNPKRTIRRLAACCLTAGALSVAMAAVAASADYYVDNGYAGGGSDGSPSAPWTTITPALDTVGPGDVVHIRGGGGSYAECIWPRTSGTAGSPITVRGEDGYPDPVLTGGVCGGSVRCVALLEVDYIHIAHIACDAGAEAMGSWVTIRSGSHNRIDDSGFSGTPAGNGVTVFVGSNGDASYNVIRGNVFDPGYPSFVNGSGDARETLILSPGSSHTLVEANDFLEGHHNTIQVLSSFNVLRGNFVTSTKHSPVSINAIETTADPAEQNVFDGNEIAGGKDTVMVKVRAPRTLVRRNVIHNGEGNGVRISQPGNDPGDLQDIRVYNNTIYRSGQRDESQNPNPPPQRMDGVLVSLANNAPLADVSGTAIVNNIVFRNNNPTNPDLEVPTAQIGLSTVQFSTPTPADPTRAMAIHNNVLLYEPGDAPGDEELFYLEPESGSAPCGTVACVEAGYPNVSDHVEADPAMVDPDNGDFRLQAGSPAIDAGRPLATVVGSWSGPEVAVDDSWWFFGGYDPSVAGIPEVAAGDTVRFGSGPVATIEAIDHLSHHLFLDQSVSVPDGDTVSLAYQGSSPDAGALEYGGGGGGGCGLGFELAGILPLLWQARRLRRREGPAD